MIRGLPICFLGVMACGAPVSVVAPLGVIYTSPSSGDAGVAVDSNVVAVFSAPLDEESVSSASVWLADPQGGAVPSSVELDTDTYGFVLTPEANLTEATSYTLHLTTELSSAVSGWLPADIAISFTTEGKTSTENAQPTADAGEDIQIVLGESATLDGTMSSDPEGTLLTYDWSVTAEGIVANELLSDTVSATPTLTPVAVGDLVVGLAVSDGEWESDRVYFTATVTKSTTASE